MKVNVLGTEYVIIQGIKPEDDNNLIENDGYIDFSTKRIIIAEMKAESGSVSDIEVYKNGVIRHELIHAFLYESGLPDCAVDEQLVEWLALQFPKMNELFKELNI